VRGGGWEEGIRFSRGLEIFLGELDYELISRCSFGVQRMDLRFWFQEYLIVEGYRRKFSIALAIEYLTVEGYR